MTNPRLIVEVRWGKLAGTKMVLRAGQTATVGRQPGADLVIAHDHEISRMHFEIAWDGVRAEVRDLGSISGTMLGGETVGSQTMGVPHGGWIQAGDTHFMVYVEGQTPPPEETFGEDDGRVERDERLRRDAAERALEELREVAQREPLYGVMDAARDDRILELLRQHVEPHRTLYDGGEGEVYDEVAPYLVGPMRDDSDLLERLVLEGWGKRWGIWCTSAAKFVEVRRHWRRFLMVELEETGERVYFRFYDPGVMARLRSALVPGHWNALLGPMSLPDCDWQ